MGQSQRKEAKEAKDATYQASFSASEVERLLNEDSSALKAWAKSKEVANELMLFESIQKRKAVYMSGKRCGDSEENLKQKIQSLGATIIEKFLEEGAPNSVNVVCSVRAEEADKHDVFDEVALQVVALMKSKAEASDMRA